MSTPLDALNALSASIPRYNILFIAFGTRESGSWGRKTEIVFDLNTSIYKKKSYNIRSKKNIWNKFISI